MVTIYFTLFIYSINRWVANYLKKKTFCYCFCDLNRCCERPETFNLPLYTHRILTTDLPKQSIDDDIEVYTL